MRCDEYRGGLRELDKDARGGCPVPVPVAEAPRELPTVEGRCVSRLSWAAEGAEEGEEGGSRAEGVWVWRPRCGDWWGGGP